MYVDETVAAKRKHPMWTLEQLLQHSYLQQNYSCPTPTIKGAPACPGPAKLQRWLLELPEVFALQCVWASSESERADIQTLMEAIPMELHADQFMKVHGGETAAAGAAARAVPGQAGGASAAARRKYSYQFRGCILYYGRHYMSVFWSSAFRSFIMFDDRRVVDLGQWPAVLERCAKGKLQPTLLFYESNDPEVNSRLDKDCKAADEADAARVERERQAAAAALQGSSVLSAPKIVSQPASSPPVPMRPPPLVRPESIVAANAFFNTTAAPGQAHIIPAPAAATAATAAAGFSVPTVIHDHFGNPATDSGSDEQEEKERSSLWRSIAPLQAATAAPGTPTFGFASPSMRAAATPEGKLQAEQRTAQLARQRSFHLQYSTSSPYAYTTRR